jgi:HEPN domain-containing protein
LQRQLEQFKKDCSLTVTDYSKPSVKSSVDTSSEERYVMRLEALTNRIHTVMEDIFKLEDKVAEEIQVLNETEQAMIIDRYIHNWSWKRICKEYNYCYTETGNSAERIVYKALKKIV